MTSFSREGEGAAKRRMRGVLRDPGVDGDAAKVMSTNDTNRHERIETGPDMAAFVREVRVVRGPKSLRPSAEGSARTPHPALRATFSLAGEGRHSGHMRCVNP
jgi:hypothetical protein